MTSRQNFACKLYIASMCVRRYVKFAKIHILFTGDWQRDESDFRIYCTDSIKGNVYVNTDQQMLLDKPLTVFCID